MPEDVAESVIVPRRVTTRTLVRIAVVAMLCAIVGALWRAVWRPAVQLHEVGLGGLLAESGRQCGDAPNGRWRTCYREVPGTQGRMDIPEQVTLDRRTRAISLIERHWDVSGAADVSRQFDSVARALERKGGQRIECPRPTDSGGRGDRLGAWRFRDQDVRVASSHLQPANGRSWWVLQIYAAPVGYSGCQQWIVARRWLTPAEIVARAWRSIVQGGNE
jgi:hypothetical protein